MITRSHYKEFPQLCFMENFSWRFQLEYSFISPVSRKSNRNKFWVFSWWMDFHQNIFIPKHCSRPLVFSCVLCVSHLQSILHYPVNPRSLVTLLVATGCKQVCPPAVKLQKTMNASEVQPKFGSIQNQPENQSKDQTRSRSVCVMWCSAVNLPPSSSFWRQSSRSLQTRAGFSRVPRGFLILSMTVLR